MSHEVCGSMVAKLHVPVLMMPTSCLCNCATVAAWLTLYAKLSHSYVSPECMSTEQNIQPKCCFTRRATIDVRRCEFRVGREYAKIDLDSDISRQVTMALDKFWSVGESQTNAEIVKYFLCNKSQFNWLDLFKFIAHNEPLYWD